MSEKITLARLKKFGKNFEISIDPEQALRGTNTKFRKRFGYIERTLEANGESLQGATLERMEELWQEAKSEMNRS